MSLHRQNKALAILQQQKCLLFAFEYVETQSLEAARALAATCFKPLIPALREALRESNVPSVSDAYSHGARDIYLLHEGHRPRDPRDAGMLLEEALTDVVFGADPRLYLEAIDEVIVVSRASVPPVLMLRGDEPVKHLDLLAPGDLPALLSAGELYVFTAAGAERRAALINNASKLIMPSTTSLACVAKNLVARYGFELVVAVDHAGLEITVLSTGDDSARSLGDEK